MRRGFIHAGRRLSFTAVALLMVATLLTSPAPAQVPAARSATPNAQSANDTGWPREFTDAGTKFLVYQPQLESWSGGRLDAQAAVAIEASQTQRPTFGVIWFTGRPEVDKDRRLVSLVDLTVVKASFPAETEKTAEYLAKLSRALPTRTKTISLDRLEAAMTRAAAARPASGRSLKNDPPRILFSETPALNIAVDGEPVLRPAGVDGLERVINTRQLVMHDPAAKRFYLRLFDGWMTSAGLTNGLWSVASDAPKSLEKALDTAVTSWDVDLMDGISPESEGTAPPSLKNGAPSIYVSTQPTELIETQGKPNFVPISGTQLLYVSNTTGNVFKHMGDQKLYVLLSGRWFRGAGPTGPWEHVRGQDLPPDFAQIPDESPKENVKASVPGTTQAEEAIIANEVPQTATVVRDQTKLSGPTYDGAPQFKPIDGTSLSYAANSPTPVIMVDEVSYYAVENGVWFTSASSGGPWVVADTIPAEIYKIPPSSPMYHVTFVEVYGSTPTEVSVGYTPGYYGSVAEDEDDDGDVDVVVYGTGWYYDSWIDDYWWGWPYTWGAAWGMCWNPWCGWGWGWGAGWGWGGGAIGGIGWGWGPGPGWRPGGFRPVVTPHGAFAGGSRGWIGSTGNVYNRWGSTSVLSRRSAGYNAQTGNLWSRQAGVAYNSRTGTLAAGHKASITNAFNGNSASAGRGVVYNPNTGLTRVGGVQGDRGSAARVGDVKGIKTDNNVFAGKDGNVYRKGDNGWEKFGKDSVWEGNQQDRARDFEREQKAREKGDKRSKDFKNYDRQRSVDKSRSVDRGRSYSGGRSYGGGGRSMGGGGRRGGGRRGR